MFEKWDFNEASISTIELKKDFRLHLSDVQPEDDSITDNLNIEIIISNVHTLFVDDKKVDVIDFPKCKGEVVNADIHDGGLDIIIEWTDYNIKPFNRFILAYKILGDNYSVTEQL